MLAILALLACAHVPPAVPEGDATAARLIAAEDRAFERLEVLCDEIGARPAGSPALEKAVAWAAETLRADGLDVKVEDVPLDVWVRGEERLTMLVPVEEELALLGLGNSVGTEGVEAPVAVVRSFDELGPEVAGKIVLYNVPMADGVPAVERYGTAVQYRSLGATRAGAHGAVAALVRSVTTRSLYTPHTGGMRYEDGALRIPAAAIAAEDADRIERLLKRGVEVRLRLEMGAHTADDAVSHNVVADLRGAEKPEEIVLVGAHLDSWDVGTGAHDDGAGVAEVIEAVRRIRALGVAPKRTIRAVLFTNEERGLHGAWAYDAAHGAERHVAAIESDLGGGRALAWSAGGTPAQLDWLKAAAAPTGVPVETDGGGGADIIPLEERGVLVVGLRADDTHYFDVHHTRADTLDKVDPAAVADASGRLAALVWGLANAPTEAPPYGTPPKE